VHVVKVPGSGIVLVISTEKNILSCACLVSCCSLALEQRLRHPQLYFCQSPSSRTGSNCHLFKLVSLLSCFHRKSLLLVLMLMV